MSGKILWICIAVILCLTVDTQAIDLKGPPTATHKPLQLSLGLEYSYSEENVQFTDHGAIALDSLNNVRRNTFFGKLGVGLLDYWEYGSTLGVGHQGDIFQG
ncbi:MAG: hypothetical protein ACYTFQ_29660 [Planctomycetota bacterium]